MEARKAAAVALNICAYAFRVIGIALCILVIMLCFPGIVNQLGLTGCVIDLSRVLPGVIAGWGVIVSPFGGVFRFDFLIVGIVFFVLDFACSRISRAVR